MDTMRSCLQDRQSALEDALAKLSRLADHDELTGLLNRRAMLSLLDIEEHRSSREELSWSIAILDVDHFKSVNDVHGHAAGDVVLKGVAELLAHRVRGCDSVARWGGEEFVIFLRDANATAASVVLDRIREEVAKLRFNLESGAIGVTISAGVAAHGRPASAAETLALADRALYRAKSVGRNRDCPADHA